ncbi:MAG: hypothetical protein HYW23_00400 [Candidatus Aenigmarchaeota archaeon]|nr:hypothetical protein [Candidatus Aenigmarchaeota archaeon]
MEDEPEAERSEKSKDIKLGEFKLRDTAVLVIKKTTYNGEDRIDFRVWMNSSKYKGPTKQGFVLTMDKIDDFVKVINNMKKKLSDAGK